MRLPKILLLTMLVVAGCQSNTLRRRSIQSDKPSRQTDLHYNGLYDALSDDSESHHYLRFYPDGTVVDVIVDTTLKKLPSWLQRDHGYGQGRYRIIGSVLTVATLEPATGDTTEYRGRISDGALFLHWSNSHQKLSGNEIYRFVPLSTAKSN